MLKKLSEKLRTKLPATTPGCSMQKFARFDDAFFEVLEGQSLQQKEKKRRKKEGEKKNPKIEKAKDVGHFLVQNAMLVARKASCCVANTFSTGLKVIWLRSSLMSQKAVFVKSSRS